MYGLVDATRRNHVQHSDKKLKIQMTTVRMIRATRCGTSSTATTASATPLCSDLAVWFSRLRPSKNT